jgi:hypothetical protein
MAKSANATSALRRIALTAWAASHGEGGLGRSPCASIALGVNGALGFADRHEGRKELLDRGLVLAKEAGDRAGEANCLQSLGDLRMRLSDLEGAKNAYEEALPIYRRLGAREPTTHARRLARARTT